jgi:hypothetical protein
MNICAGILSSSQGPDEIAGRLTSATMHPSQFGVSPASNRFSSGRSFIELLGHSLGEPFIDPVGLRTPSFGSAWWVGLSSSMDSMEMFLRRLALHVAPWCTYQARGIPHWFGTPACPLSIFSHDLTPHGVSVSYTQPEVSNQLSQVHETAIKMAFVNANIKRILIDNA